MFFELVKVPVLQNRVFESMQEALNAEHGELDIQQHSESGIFVNQAFDSSKMVYDHLYDNEQAHSATFEQHLNEVCDILDTYIDGKNVIEVGCGKGYFFKKLGDRNPASLAGCDPAYQGDDERISKSAFSPGLGLRGDVIILRHVLEHIQEPVSFLHSIAESNGYTGLIYIEVPDLHWIVKNQVYFDLFYEHVNYFVPDDFTRIFGKVYERGSLFNGQYQYAIADLATINSLPFTFSMADADFAVAFKRLDSLVLDLQRSDRPIFIWGAASKGVISALHLGNRGISVDGLIDINPKKQGKYAAFTGLPIFSPASFKERVESAIVLIANPNYENEIRADLLGWNIDFRVL